jgi:hypothetical protein
MKQIIAIIALGFLVSCSEDDSKRRDKKKVLLKEVGGHNCQVRYVDNIFVIGDTLSFPEGKGEAKQFVIIR